MVNSWYILLGEIRDYLSKAIPQTIAVVIIDMSLSVLPIHLPVEESHPIIPIWDRLIHDVIRDLNSPLWPSISCVRQGRERVNSPECLSQIQKYEATIIQGTINDGLSGNEVAFLEVKIFS